MKGVIVPTLTTLTDNGEFDEFSQNNLIKYLAENNVDGIFGLGYTGEYLFLDKNTKLKAMTSITQSANNLNLDVIMGVTGKDLDETLTYLDCANHLNINGIVIQLSRFNNYEKVLDKILENSNHPLYLYVNRHTALNKKEVITPNNVKDIINNDKILGIKISDDLDNFIPYYEALKGTNTKLYMGNAFDLKQFTDIDGIIVGDGNLYPSEWSRVWSLKDTNLSEKFDYWQLFEKFRDWHHNMPAPHNGIAVLKYCLYKQGIIDSPYTINPISDLAKRYLLKDIY